MTSTEPRPAPPDQQRSGLDLGAAFIRAIATLDNQALAACLAPEVRFRALTPRTIWDEQGAEAALGVVGRWFGDCTSIETLAEQVEWAADRLSLHYRFHVIEEGRPFLVEQHAYCKAEDGVLTDISLVCSGFRRVSNEAP